MTADYAEAIAHVSQADAAANIVQLEPRARQLGRAGGVGASRR
jgi:hypothetical protein